MIVSLNSYLHERLGSCLKDWRLQFGHSSSGGGSSSCSGGAVCLLDVFCQRRLCEEPHGALVAEECMVPFWNGGKYNVKFLYTPLVHFR